MTHFAIPLLLAAITVPYAAQAQFVKGNEAVTQRPDGTKKVETPPIPATSSVSKGRPCPANAGCHAGSWHMVETEAGLKECTEPWARASACRESSYGTTKRLRLWVLKKEKTWFLCQYPDLGSKCVDMYARPPLNLPYPALQ